MSQHIKLKKGFNINLAGKPQQVVAEADRSETFSVKPTDFIGIIRPKVTVREGDVVKAGTPVLFDKKMNQVMYCAPVSGEVVEIVRGEKRKLLEIKILADKQIEYEQFKEHSASELSGISREQAQETMLKGGVWPQLIQRPYGIVANPEDTPKAIFISTFDTHPLAPDYDVLLKNQASFFEAGIEILKKFTSGKVNLGVNADAEVSPIFSNVKGVQVNKFSGPHPAGNVGVHIHHTDPIGKGDLVWTIDPYGVVQIGKMFLNGVFDASKTIALTGSEVKEPKYYQTYIGACIDKLVEGNIKQEHVRYISGNVLTGEKISKQGYLGFYHHQLTVIPEGDQYEFLGWLKPTTSKLSFHRALGLLSFLNPKKEFVLTTNTLGEERAFVQTGIFEKVTPMDILPEYLIKAIMAEDYDDMEALGIFEVIEEDLALCEFIDVSKHEIQAILREGINLIKATT
ncbi:Na+-transporting NADH:ubiquinone oxidoreductase subunit A [Catalinimonas alkaloidigena]|uniref:Na(+)-translocating NADH-quinone reductase subunit A n=1 Tax=Catalinimonas alkaloidigena TaxID=1075417 RepID=UPI0024058AA9|nr:Na(+)-translocating NADH-quinone reductase subunit A [Catalinimonas alkaloidigena]MDF9795270.1 Na+-transporting NADH:ubiquinone oxidoreductase subunit A [Catalinimonas alkaloidigena]